jgi:hypothetical protein
MTASPHRARLPIRRPAITQDIIVGNITLSATLGFDEAGRPAELFLSGAKDGSGLASILEDASVVISVRFCAQYARTRAREQRTKSVMK